jgi:hypothetical protein
MNLSLPEPCWVCAPGQAIQCNPITGQVLSWDGEPDVRCGGPILTGKSTVSRHVAASGRCPDPISVAPVAR